MFCAFTSIGFIFTSLGLHAFMSSQTHLHCIHLSSRVVLSLAASSCIKRRSSETRDLLCCAVLLLDK